MAAKSTRPKAARAAAYSTPSADPRPGGVAKAFYVEISRKGGAPAPPPQRAAAHTPPPPTPPLLPPPMLPLPTRQKKKIYSGIN